MSRLIDADALLEAYDKAHEGPPGAARRLIEDAPTVGGWISVKDRLPKTNEMVLVLVKSKEYNYHVIAMLMQDGDWDSNDDYFCMSDDEVIYWMPLPEPPEEVEECE